MFAMKKIIIPLVFLFALTVLTPPSVGLALQDNPSTHLTDNFQVDDGTFSFAQLNEGERRMFGPFATETVLFGLPANWLLTADAQLELEYTVLIQSANETTATGQFFGGSLTILMNNNVVSVLPVDRSGRFSQSISIPMNLFTSSRRDGRQQLTMVLSSGQSCLLDARVEATIHSSSRFVIPHEVTLPDTDLTHFPRPLYQDSIFVDSALIVIPDQPTSSELQAALTVSAGLQARTGGALELNVINHSALTDEQRASTHLVLVGNAASMPIFYQLATPLTLVDGFYKDVADAGVLQMIPSPWSSERAVLIVSGNNDQATINAAQALSTGVIRTSNISNLALVDGVNNRVYFEDTAVNQTLESLGYESVTFEGRGETAETFQFYIPAGQTVSPEAYFEMSISNSTLLNYARSGVFVTLNDQPIGSVRLSDETANKANNRIQISIPPSAIHPGLNFLDVVAALEPLDECADPNQAGLFVTLWADSRLYLPLMPLPAERVDIPDLSTYPAPFVQSPDLGKVAFVLQRDNPDAWASAIRIAGYLGGIADGVIFTPVAFYADETASVDLSGYNILAVGLPSKMDFIETINEKMPVPFEPGSDIASEEELQVMYRIDPEQPAGYLQLLSSPWNFGNTIVAVMGNSPQGITWSANTLISSNSRQSLLGNFAIVREDQVVSVDTRSLRLEPPIDSPEPVATLSVVDAPENTTTVPVSVTSWIPVALAISIVLILVVIVLAIMMGRRRTE